MVVHSAFIVEDNAKEKATSVIYMEYHFIKWTYFALICIVSRHSVVQIQNAVMFLALGQYYAPPSLSPTTAYYASFFW